MRNYVQSEIGRCQRKEGFELRNSTLERDSPHVYSGGEYDFVLQEPTSRTLLQELEGSKRPGIGYHTLNYFDKKDKRFYGERTTDEPLMLDNHHFFWRFFQLAKWADSRHCKVRIVGLPHGKTSPRNHPHGDYGPCLNDGPFTLSLG